MSREDILIAAAEIFGKKGFHAASMADIAQAVNLQKASLYHHFPSKQEILLALLEQALDLLIERLEGVLQQPLPPEEKLRQAMILYLTTLAEHQELSLVLLIEHRSLDPKLRSQHIPRRDRYERLWRDLVQEGKQNGVFDCQDASMTSRALLGVMNWTMTWYRQEGPQSIERIADQFTHLFLHGLLVRPGMDD